MSRKIVVRPATQIELSSGDFLLVITPSIDLMEYINMCEEIHDKIDAMNHSQIYRVEFRMPYDTTFYDFYDGNPPVSLEEEEISIVELNDVDFECADTCDCGDIITFTKVQGETWLTFRVYAGDDTPYELWVDIEKDVLFNLIKEGSDD